MTSSLFLQIAAITALPLVLVLSVYIFLQKKRLALLTAKTEELRRDYFLLEEKYARLKLQAEQTKTFQESLKDAQISTKLQQSRLGQDRKELPMDRYRHIAALSKSGAGKEEIAEALSVSTHEARQLMALSRLAADQGG
ncbi:MAG: hypothetical protein CSB24_05650 [Deltaproteobacteria bacterium]|nr:MAG: hypothetical protein CSB24_05650 [Deltaproteobacteria bacterium]